MNGRSVKICAEKPLMSVTRVVGLVVVLLTAGCAGLEHAAPGSELTQTGAAAGAVAAIEPVVPPAASTHEPPQTGASESGADVVKPMVENAPILI